MRFAYAHKMTTYLMVWSAFFAVTLSGEVPGLMVVLSAPAVALSWFWEAPAVRIERWSRWWTGGSVLFFLYSVLSAFGTGDFLLSATGFILFLLVAKLYSRRSCRDYLHIYVLAFLLLVAGTVLNAELTYGIFFLGFVVSATWALTLFHLRREMEDNFLLKHSDNSSSERVQVARILNSRRIVGRPFFLGTAAVSITIFLSAALMFLTIPRIGFGLFFNKSRSGVQLAGFSDGVKLGGHGVIKTDSTIVMRVKVDEKYQGRRAPYVHWRGVAFDQYSDGQWRRSRLAPITTERVRLGAGKNRHYLTYNTDTTRAELERALESATRQDIYLEPLGNDVLFAAAMPVAFDFDRRFKERPHKSRNDEIRHPHNAGIKYTVFSALDPPASSELRAAGKKLPSGFGVYLQIPDEITTATREKAAEITAGATTDYDKALAIEEWLSSNLGYTLRLESPGKREPIDFFLFDRREGHCEYFSSAMTIMLRSVGVPARNVNGFLGGEWNEYDDYIAVRAGDAHSWVEVYFDGHGWVTFDPTPSAEVDQLGRGGESWYARLKRMTDTLRFKWFKWVIEYDLGRQLGLFRDVGRAIKRAARRLFSIGPGGAKSWLSRNKRTLVGIAGAITVLVMLIGWLRRRKKRGVARPVRRSRAMRGTPAVRAFLRAERRYRKLGMGRGPAMTPREHAHELATREAPGADAYARLIELYYAAVWSRSPSAEELADLGKRALEALAAIESAIDTKKP